MPKLKLETLILVIFFLSAGVLGYRKCAANRSSYVQKNTTSDYDYSVDRPMRTDSLAGIETGGQTRPQTYSAPEIQPGGQVPSNAGDITSVPTAPAKQTQKPQTPATSNSVLKPTTVSKAPPNVSQPQTSAPTIASGEERSVLYITIDRLKMRDKPGLKGKLIKRLKLHEKVYFAGERTDYKEELSLGYVMANEPWIKIETQSGQVGWVYGAGVDMMKTVREGVR